ncbi:hypothetical protein A3I27_02515 [Candidatus Giovannonibacteria bacterium RIFCSPLOWO2_02_FULL_43_11b]|uniref:NAD-dependent epimerase/dehydratase domain-containing protein n=1 Tax=Candidatus Giovannonibacteria bacterium RIFCSPHIGHO2_12_FULL_43_15 TaxID=1798341 RepID=A0A1F5WNM6_9BACT|nr:MAG: hypothetical protein A3B97_01950 [Candidatus Giovannonibacteria bacterium RIFCSPHIGHO2_02_FULL_43_32]OGF77258.1 MAG: hypothetical protein A3F23_01250 [Candidatus Giovannonibacteria bacterium RIFCSPHIGHO2_12_FULL_43_15]OGF79211.1 MAG: hypothetical protein A3A15_01135 [Candidatus Giovannonibacteria bacterium RIFCSPLOWO2_01_FULL_43_60]OGF90515.1 MAG: hypothetical protein A3I27_02515 [Candidatus Giovannonibacteria bacterium RIFCSPLOWO2_02_FULL_43_11b]OGF91872.1 MAG: hypothetical protein A3H
MKRVIVTGSLGYLGSALTDFLQKSGFNCIGYDTGFFEKCILYEPPSVTTVLRDVRDITDKDLAGAYAVVHLAGISNDPVGNLKAENVYDPTRAYSLEIAKMCKKLGVKFIFASSCSVYGKGGEELFTEESPLYPQTPYSFNKVQIENDLRALSDKNFSPIALRFATVFGLSTRIRLDVVVNMFAGMAFTSKKIVLNSDGTPWRPNVHILDVCEAVRQALGYNWDGGELLILNVGNESNNFRVIDLAKIVQGAVPGCELNFLAKNTDLDKEGLIRTKSHEGTDTRSYKVSFEKTRKTFPGFRAERSVEAGVHEIVAKFSELNFNEKDFKNRKFYRLQTLEDFFTGGRVTDELRWR